jgi:phosphate transport system substrate-binding protein
VGTGGGFKSFPDPAKKLDICDASRPVQQKELEECVKNGVKFVELPIGIDAITMVVSVKNDFLKEITLAELQKLWAPGADGKGEVTKWSQVREGWPDESVSLFGADSASGTFEYFNEAVHHDKKKTRSDYTANSNDNILVQGVEKNKFALGYIPYAYYVPRAKTLRAVKVKMKEDAEAVEPTPQTISTGSYHPFARPLFIYVNQQSLERPEVASFTQFYIENAAALSSNAGYIAFDPPIYAKVRERLEKRDLGTAFGGTLKEDMNLTTIMDVPVQSP